MKKHLLLLTVAFTSVCAWSQTRFLDNVLSPAQIGVTPNVVYAQNYTRFSSWALTFLANNCFILSFIMLFYCKIENLIL